MERRENNRNDRVEIAWSRLYNRIESEGLLPEQAAPRESHRFAYLGLAATFTILMVASVALFKAFYSSTNEGEIHIVNSDQNSAYVKVLEDGSAVYLGSNATLSLPNHFGKMRRVTKLRGDAFFEIERSPSRPFVIETDLVKVEVLGTSFSVTQSSVSVRTGKVRVWLKRDGSEVTLKAGEGVNFDKDKIEKRPVSISASQFDRYTGKIHFKDEKLSEVVKILNRNLSKGGSKESILIDKTLDNRLVTATFSNETTLSCARMICIALGLEYNVSPSGNIQIYKAQ